VGRRDTLATPNSRRRLDDLVGDLVREVGAPVEQSA
jgi:hypothetical protein